MVEEVLGRVVLRETLFPVTDVVLVLLPLDHCFEATRSCQSGVCVSSLVYAVRLCNCFRKRKSEKRRVSAHSKVSALVACSHSRTQVPKHSSFSAQVLPVPDLPNGSRGPRASPPPRRVVEGRLWAAPHHELPRSVRTPRVSHRLRSRARLARSSIHACLVPRTRQMLLGGCRKREGERVIWLPSPARARRSWRRRECDPRTSRENWTHEVGRAVTTRYVVSVRCPSESSTVSKGKARSEAAPRSTTFKVALGAAMLSWRTKPLSALGRKRGKPLVSITASVFPSFERHSCSGRRVTAAPSQLLQPRLPVRVQS